MSLRWAIALRAAGASDAVVSRWHGLRAAVGRHQRVLARNGIGREVDERERVRVNARRVGLEAPLFADEAEKGFADVLGVLSRRSEVVGKGGGGVVGGEEAVAKAV